MRVTKASCEVFESPSSLKVIKTFNNVEALYNYAKENNLYADQCAINDCVLLGWDELYDFV